jgi:branched-chain amino acid transport system permease protein
MEDLVLQFASGLLKAMFLFLLASGMSLIFGVSRVLNIAHGAFYALGAYMLLTVSLGHTLATPIFALATIAVGLALGVLGAAFEIVVLRRVYRAGMLYVALVTFGLLMLIEETIRIVWGGGFTAVPRPLDLQGGITIGAQQLPTYNVVLLCVGVLIAIILWLLVERTKIGLQIRAAAMDREMLSALGVDVPRLYTLTFAAGTFLAGIAGALAAPMVTVTPSMGSTIVIEVFAVVVIGGLGSLPGSLIGALIVGELGSFGVIFAPEASLPLLYLLMAIILVIRPAGLLGKPDQA